MATPEEQAFFDWFAKLSPDEQSNFQATYGNGTGPATTTAPTTPPPVAGVTGVTTTPGTNSEVASRNRAVFNTMATVLRNAGLGDLFTLDSSGKPGGWLWDQITSGVDDEAALQLAFEQTPQFQARFPAIVQMRAGAAAGGTGYVPTPSEVREYEAKVSATMRQAGIPTWFYDTPAELQSLMAANVSPLEVEERLGRSWEMVRNTDPLVREAFTEFFGVEGENAMAAFFLDPARTTAALDKAARTAYTRGMGRSVGVEVDRTMADRVANLPLTEAGIMQNLTSVAQVSSAGGVLDEGITETQDITQADALDASFFGDGQALADMERRRLERDANSRSSLGGAALTQAGAVGVSRS